MRPERTAKYPAGNRNNWFPDAKLSSIIHHIRPDVNNFLLYHRKTGNFPQNKNTKSGGKFCVLAKNYARSCAKSKPGTQNIGCNLFCRKIWILFKNGWEKQKSPAPQVPGQRKSWLWGGPVPDKGADPTDNRSGRKTQIGNTCAEQHKGELRRCRLCS